MSQSLEPFLELTTYVVNAKVVQRLGNLYLFLGVKESIRKLFSFTKCALDNLYTRGQRYVQKMPVLSSPTKARDIAQEISNRLVWIPAWDMRVL